VEVIYLGVAILYLIVFLIMFRLPQTGKADSGARSAMTDLADGFKYIRLCPALIPLLALVFVRGFLGMPYRTMMPKYAQDVMGLDATGLGLLLSAPGVGSLISSLTMASLGNFRGKGRLLLISGIVMGASLVAFGNARSFALVLVLLAIVGAASNVCMVTNRTLLQLNCDPPYLGRLMSAYMMMFGLTQLGTMPAGAIADTLGVPLVITVQGALFAVVFVAIWAMGRKIRALE
jgi:Na+/melibiose symporter-like transporter